MPKECRLAIGDFCLSLVYEQALDPYFREYYSGFLCDERDPDITIELDVVPHPVGAYEAPRDLMMAKEVRGNHFNFGSGLLKGFLHLPEKRCNITIKEAMLGGGGIRNFEKFLCQVYYTLLHGRDPLPADFLVHASGVVRNGKGFAFSGPSGCGKSTISSLSSQETVLNDDTIIVARRNSSFWIRSTPFNGRFRSKEMGEAPLRAVFLLEHAKQTRLEPLGRAEFAARFTREVVFSASLLSTDNRSTFSEMLDFSSQLIEEVPAYQLGFCPDRSFWKCIEKEGLL